jgi:hypothetical protein
MKRAVPLVAGSIATFLGCGDSVIVIPDGEMPAPIPMPVLGEGVASNMIPIGPEPNFGDVVVQASPPAADLWRHAHDR